MTPWEQLFKISFQIAYLTNPVIYIDCHQSCEVLLDPILGSHPWNCNSRKEIRLLVDDIAAFTRGSQCVYFLDFGIRIRAGTFVELVAS
jgi:hypothetical protein